MWLYRGMEKAKHFLLVSGLFGGCALAKTSCDMQEVIESITPYQAGAIITPRTTLIEQERMGHDKQSLDSFTQAFDALLTKHSRSTKKTKKEKKSAQKIAKTLQTLAAGKHDVLTWQVTQLIDQAYDDASLSMPVSCEFNYAPFAQAVAVLSACTHVPLIVQGQIGGVVQNLKLTDVTLGSALRALCQSQNPACVPVFQGGLWYLMPLAQAIAVYSLRSLQTCVSQTIPIVHCIWNDAFKKRIESLWRSIAGVKDNKDSCYIAFDDYAKKIFCRGQREMVDAFTQAIEQIDVLVPQVRLDVRVVLANKDFEESLGFNWSGIYNRRASVTHTDFVGVGPITSSDPTKQSYAESHDLFKDLISWSLNFIPSGLKPTMSIPFVFGNKDLSTKRLNIFLNAAETRNQMRTILKPSLLVHNEELAEILVGDELPQEVRLDETIEGKFSNVTSTGYKPVGMRIKVKPVVRPDQNEVFLELYVENSFVATPEVPVGSTVDTGNGGSVKRGYNYTIRTTQSKNKVLLCSGQTTMIGGLMTTVREKEKSGVPYLQEIPVLGWFFQGTRRVTRDRQLMIFITPTLCHQPPDDSVCV